MATKRIKRNARNTRKRGGSSTRQTPRSTRESRVGTVTHRRLNFPPTDDLSFFNLIYKYSQLHGETGTSATIEEIRRQEHAPYSTTISSGLDIYKLMHHLRVHREIIRDKLDDWKLPITLFRKVLRAYSGFTGHTYDEYGTFLRTTAA